MSEQKDFDWLPIAAVKAWDKNPRRNGKAIEPVARSIVRDRTQSTIWDITNLNPRGGGGKGDDAPVGHGTQKPIECMARPIRNHFQPGIIVCDPFHGSGTTLIAAERERRLCYAMELASNYVAAQLERCVKIGLEPRLA